MKKYKSFLGFFNYHIFWSGWVLTYEKETNPLIKLKRRYTFKKIKDVFGHNDKSKIWTDKNQIKKGEK